MSFAKGFSTKDSHAFLSSVSGFSFFNVLHAHVLSNRPSLLKATNMLKKDLQEWWYKLHFFATCSIYIWSNCRVVLRIKMLEYIYIYIYNISILHIFHGSIAVTQLPLAHTTLAPAQHGRRKDQWDTFPFGWTPWGWHLWNFHFARWWWMAS